MRVCTRCSVQKPIEMFGHCETVAGRRILRAQCRACYNDRRRVHYADAGVHELKIRKRREYERRVGFAEKRKVLRQSDPVLRAKEKLARDRYRARPDIRETLRLKKAEHRTRPLVKADTLYSASKLRAARKGIPFALTKSWIRERVISGRCELTGLQFDYGPAPNGWCYNPRSPSIDQRIAGAGYTPENCRVVITSVNNALSQYGEDHFSEVAIAFLMRRGYRVSR